MIQYLPISIILAILGTLLVNPVFYYHLFKKRKEYKEALRDFEKEKEEGKDPEPVKKSDYKMFRRSPKFLIVGQILLFMFLFVLHYFLFSPTEQPIRCSTLLVFLWISGIGQVINFIAFLGDNSCFSNDNDIQVSLFFSYLILAVTFFLIPICICIHTGVYNYHHTYEHITIMEENYKEYPMVDETALLKEANLADGSTIKEPIYRNGNWIYPVVNNSLYVTSSGYFVVDSVGENITFVEKDIVYSPWILSDNNVKYVVRRALPSAVLFGNVTFQIEPESGYIYFCQFYGDYECFRAGRKVEGAILIDAETGEYTIYSMKEIPYWVTGISF